MSKETCAKCWREQKFRYGPKWGQKGRVEEIEVSGQRLRYIFDPDGEVRLVAMTMQECEPVVQVTTDLITAPALKEELGVS